MRYNYEPEPDAFPADAYREKASRYAVAWHILGWHTKPDGDTYWTGIEERTGLIVARMVGDDALHLFDVDDLEPIEELDYCHQCGQIGCTHDGLERD